VIIHGIRRRWSPERARHVPGLAGALLLGGLALGAIAAGDGSWPQPAPGAPSWPPAPYVARITYVASITEPRDIGAGPNVLGRIWGFIAGRSRRPRVLRPSGLATDSAGRLIVGDIEQQMVHVFDVGRRRYSYLDAAPFASPVGVAVGPDDTIYVADSGRRCVFVYGRDGKRRRTLGLVNGEAIFVRPSGVAYGPDGLIYVVDAAAATITALTLDGRVVRTIGRRGSEPGEFNYPTHLTFGPDGLIYVVDAMNARVQVLQPDGTFVRAFGRRGNGTGDFDKPKGIALDPDGHVYVAEGLHDVVQVFDAGGRLLLVVGQSGEGQGQFAFPSNLHVDRAGRVYVADALNGRVQVFQYVSRPDGD